MPLQMGAMVVQAQRTGCAMPEAVGEVHDALLEGATESFPLRSVLDFLNNHQQTGRLTLEAGQGSDAVRAERRPGPGGVLADDSARTGWRASFRPNSPTSVRSWRSTLGEQQDASMAGLVKMLEQSLSDPRRLRAL